MGTNQELQVKPLDNVGVEVFGFDINEPISDAMAAQLGQWKMCSLMV